MRRIHKPTAYITLYLNDNSEYNIIHNNMEQKDLTK